MPGNSARAPILALAVFLCLEAPAAAAGITAGDVVTKVNEYPVSSFADLIAREVRPCTAEVAMTTSMQPVVFPDQITGAIAKAADTEGLKHRALASGAFHDAAHIASVCPSGMIFIPCRGGLSHHPDEWATPEHCAAGARVLAGALAQLAA